MAIDEISKSESKPVASPGPSSHTGKFVAIFVIAAGLVIGEIFTFSRFNSFQTVEATARKNLVAQIQEQLSTSISDIQRSNAAQMEEMKTALDAASKRLGSTRAQVHKTSALLSKFQQDQAEQAEALKQQIAQKADLQQFGALTQDVSATKSDLDTTKKTVEGVRSDLGMARSELGTLIARNHDDIETLRKLGERDYFEFNLTRNKEEKVANVGLKLTKTNVKRHRYSLMVDADELSVEKKDRTINEPIFLYLKGSKKPCEIVVNRVQSGKVTGYISTPKGVTEVAAAPAQGQ